MAILKSCCCFSNMTSACVATGVYTIFMAALGLFGVIAYLVGGTFSGVSYLIICLSGTSFLSLLLAGIFLLHGTRKKYPFRGFVMAFIVITAVHILFFTGLFIALFISSGSAGEKMPIAPAIILPTIWFVVILFHILGLLCGVSFYQQLQEEGLDQPINPLSGGPDQSISSEHRVEGGEANPGLLKSPYNAHFTPSSADLPPSYDNLYCNKQEE